MEGRNDAIVSRGDGVSYLFSEHEYDNFHLRAEAQINSKGDSGICFRSEFGLSHHGKSGVSPAGYEAQILIGGKGKEQRTGSLCTFAPVNDRLVEPDSWFVLEVIAEGKHIIIKVDGKTTVDFTDEKGTHTRGHIAIQQYTPDAVVKIRTIEVKDLSRCGRQDRPGKIAGGDGPLQISDAHPQPRGPRHLSVFSAHRGPEAAYNRAGVKVDLSVEHLIWLRNVACGSDKNDRGTAEDMSCMVGGGNGMYILRQLASAAPRTCPTTATIFTLRPSARRWAWDNPIGQAV